MDFSQSNTDESVQKLYGQLQTFKGTCIMYMSVVIIHDQLFLSGNTIAPDGKLPDGTLFAEQIYYVIIKGNTCSRKWVEQQKVSYSAIAFFLLTVVETHPLHTDRERIGRAPQT
jgi:hypothetical protein